MSAWKSFEKSVGDFFLSRRVPLSGKNSGHATSADVFPPPEYGSLFIECKRNKAFLSLVKQYRGYLKNGDVVCTVNDDECFYLYDLLAVDKDLKIINLSKSITVFNKLLRKNNALISLHSISKKSAIKENKKDVIICLRLHTKHGIFAFSYSDVYHSVRSWIKNVKHAREGIV